MARVLHASACLLSRGIHQWGRILGMLGREEGAQEAYRETVQQAAGVSPDSFIKALASP